MRRRGFDSPIVHNAVKVSDIAVIPLLQSGYVVVAAYGSWIPSVEVRFFLP